MHKELNSGCVSAPPYFMKFKRLLSLDHWHMKSALKAHYEYRKLTWKIQDVASSSLHFGHENILMARNMMRLLLYPPLRGCFILHPTVIF